MRVVLYEILVISLKFKISFLSWEKYVKKTIARLKRKINIRKYIIKEISKEKIVVPTNISIEIKKICK